MKPDLKFYIQRFNFGRRIEIAAVLSTPNMDMVRVAAPITMADHSLDSIEQHQAPMLSLKVPEAQGLMDALWGAGLRPTEGEGSAGSLAATERHLKDMQTVAMGLLRKEGVQL